ncbi:NUDIX domain-containing protein [Streptomyces sp. FH025]|uniref:NUDIX domain-containing protein n=1 Tax=Streptomyces sp. FH025 TaxID=2815937 RepID=UPI001A9CD122|nr:NUDIX hydrolase [Streptomyces sp. FH025]MBO1415242.1 NUDIX hydrolase [Streptomyces sp. FH025]
MSDNDAKKEPRRRLGALVLVRSTDGLILLIKPTYRPGLQLPGGSVHPGEQIADAAARELAEETGLHRRIAHHLGVDQVPANPSTGAVEGFNFICDGGFATDEEVGRLDRQGVPVGAAEEVRGYAWISPDELDAHTEPYMAARIRAAVRAADNGQRQPLLYIGFPAEERHAA